MEHSGSTDKTKGVRKGSSELTVQCLSDKRPQCTVEEGKWKGQWYNICNIQAAIASPFASPQSSPTFSQRQFSHMGRWTSIQKNYSLSCCNEKTPAHPSSGLILLQARDSTANQSFNSSQSWWVRTKDRSGFALPSSACMTLGSSLNHLGLDFTYKFKEAGNKVPFTSS